ncbi:FG-GAP repeat domain-containing protein [Sphaerisporangium aureirubrum]|uniref:FG-GAP repeat domain-containing protein n=1 Tax=Sphaerisporangium aureirubrum TaxID=1544736 RepID=A0ABW1NKT9_9ACTN
MIAKLRAGTAAILSLILIVVGWRLAELPASSAAMNSGIAQRFKFEQSPLNGAANARTIREVAPAYRNIDHWISAVGASVALADLDGNGLADDACLVDPRDDSVTVRPVPGTGARYPAMTLSPTGLAYDATMAPTGCVPGDYNEDGRLDVLTYYWGRSPVVFLRGAGPLAAPAFTARELVTPYQVWNTNAVTIADMDGDGHNDVVVGNFFPDKARVLDPKAHQDDLLVMQRSMSAAYNGGTDHILLFHSATAGGVTYTEAKAPFGDDDIANGWTLAFGAQDLNGDGLPELYMAHDFGPDRLMLNESTPGKVRLTLMGGIRHFGTPKSKVLGKDSFKGMGVAFTELNADDTPDIVVSNIAENYALHESNFAWVSARPDVIGKDGVAYYDDKSEPLGLSRSGWGWDVKAGDFAGEGDHQIMMATGFIKGTVNRWPQLQELALTNDDLLNKPGSWPRLRQEDDLSGSDPNPFWSRGADGRYHDVAALLGVDDPGPTRGLALADVDHDGKLDFAVANQWRQSYFYRNTRTTRHPFLGLRLQRPAACATGAAAGAPLAPAVGAGVTIPAGASGVRVGQLYPANGHAGVSAPEMLFGLSGSGAVPVTLTWRDACGVRHTGSTNLTPGWHSLSLGADGSIEKVTK